MDDEAVDGHLTSNDSWVIHQGHNGVELSMAYGTFNDVTGLWIRMVQDGHPIVTFMQYDAMVRMIGMVKDDDGSAIDPLQHDHSSDVVRRDIDICSVCGSDNHDTHAALHGIHDRLSSVEKELAAQRKAIENITQGCHKLTDHATQIQSSHEDATRRIHELEEARVNSDVTVEHLRGMVDVLGKQSGSHVYDNERQDDGVKDPPADGDTA